MCAWDYSYLHLRGRSLPPLFPCSVAQLALQPRYVHYDNRFLVFEELRIFQVTAFHAALYPSSRRWRMRVQRGLTNPGLRDSPLQCVRGLGIVSRFAIAEVSNEVSDTTYCNRLPPTKPRCHPLAQEVILDIHEAPRVGWKKHVWLLDVPSQQLACTSSHTGHFPVQPLSCIRLP